MESFIEKFRRLTLKSKLGILIIGAYDLGDCPSAYDPSIYTPVTDQKEIEELGLR